MKFYVYEREIDQDTYPEGLALAVHFAYETADGVRQPLNKNYGILFAKGEITKDNTILPVGVRSPKIFAMEEGWIGICGERVPGPGKVLWRTRDLIHFEEAGIIGGDELQGRQPSAFSDAKLQGYQPSESLDVPEEIAREAISYWTPIRATEVSVPEIKVRNEKELERIAATVTYCDGSKTQKRILWETEDIDFGRPGTYQVKGRVDRPYFPFPLAKGYGDPVIFLWEGKWYYISTNDNLNDIGFYAREAENVHGLFAEGVKEHLILPFDPVRGLEQTFWAPEFHVIGGELYLLFAVSGHAWGPQCHLMKLKKGGSIIDANSWEDPVRVQRKDGTPLAQGPITLDMTYVKAGRGSYVIWSYRENIMSPLDTGSMLFIASIDEREPWRLTSDPVLLTRPLYGWENVSGTINNEGPYAFVRDGKVYVTYSGGAANGYTYALGLLTANEDADLLQLASWHKSITPVLTFYSVDGEFGPGHNSFFTLPWQQASGADLADGVATCGAAGSDGVTCGADLMIAYHAETDIREHLRCDGIRRVHFRKDKTPYFQMSAQEDLPEELSRICAAVTVL